MTRAAALPAALRRAPTLSLTAGLLALALLVAAAYLNHDPSGLALVPGCVFRATFGIPCFGCGLTRVFLLLAKGEVVAALALAPLPFLLVTGSLSLLVWDVVARVRGSASPDRVVERWLAARGHLLGVVVFVLALWGYAIARSLTVGAP